MSHTTDQDRGMAAHPSRGHTRRPRTQESQIPRKAGLSRAGRGDPLSNSMGRRIRLARRGARALHSRHSGNPDRSSQRRTGRGRRRLHWCDLRDQHHAGRSALLWHRDEHVASRLPAKAAQRLRHSHRLQPVDARPRARLHPLGDLDEVAAGVVEHGRGHRTHRDRLLRKSHAECPQPVELGGDVGDGK